MPNTLLYRLGVFNIVCLIGVSWAWAVGWAQQIYEGDVTKIVLACVGLFLVGLVSVWVRAIKLVREGVGNLQLFLARQQYIASISEWLVMIALLGTVVGISLAMGGTLEVGSVEATREFTSNLLKHIHVAFNVTIVGILLSVWNAVNWTMLNTATIVSGGGGEQ